VPSFCRRPRSKKLDGERDQSPRARALSYRGAFEGTPRRGFEGCGHERG
jgi:hypothetical protein